MPSKLFPKYSHDALQATVWRTVPEEIPESLRHRYMMREAIRKQALQAQTLVYYIRMPEASTRSGCIKIGFTTNLRGRLFQLTDRYGEGAEVLATEPGDGSLETRRHQQWSMLSRGGFNEYFYESPELIAFIDDLLAAWGPPMITGYLPDDWPWPA